MKRKKCSQRFLVYQLFEMIVTLVCHWIRLSHSKSWYPVCKSLEPLHKHRVTLEVGPCLYQLAKDCYQGRSRTNKSAKQSSISGVNQSLLWLYFRLLSTTCSPYRSFRESKLSRWMNNTEYNPPLFIVCNPLPGQIFDHFPHCRQNKKYLHTVQYEFV